MYIINYLLRIFKLKGMSWNKSLTFVADIQTHFPIKSSTSVRVINYSNSMFHIVKAVLMSVITPVKPSHFLPSLTWLMSYPGILAFLTWLFLLLSSWNFQTMPTPINDQCSMWVRRDGNCPNPNLFSYHTIIDQVPRPSVTKIIFFFPRNDWQLITSNSIQQL